MLYVAWYLIAVNFAVFALFGLDKWKAETGRYRVPEASLLQWSALGGTGGAYAGRALFRHKTRKQPFCERLHRIAIVQGAALAGLAVFWLTG